MLRGILSGLTIASLMALSGCSNSSDYPTVPPPPPEGTVQAAPAANDSTKGVMKQGRKTRPAPTSPTAL